MDLTDRERAMLAFERRWWRYGATRGSAARERFDLGPGEYGAIIADLIDRPAALAHDPVLVRRLRRLRDSRRLERSERVAA
jgi:hypothetical protein